MAEQYVLIKEPDVYKNCLGILGSKLAKDPKNPSQFDSYEINVLNLGTIVRQSNNFKLLKEDELTEAMINQGLLAVAEWQESAAKQAMMQVWDSITEEEQNKLMDAYTVYIEKVEEIKCQINKSSILHG